MSNRQMDGSRIFLVFLVTGLLALGLTGCGSGDGSTSAEAATRAYWRSHHDTSPPSVPTNFAASAVSSAQIDLTWSASTDNRAVTGYRIWRNGTLLPALETVTTFEDIGLTGSTAYTYTVEAVDGAGNVSGQSNAAVATTLAANATPPTVSATSPADAATNIAANSAITVTFSEAMLQSTLSINTFKLTTQAGAPIAGTVSASSTAATFTPSAPLAASTPYTATITTGATNSAGNALAANFTWNFATGAVPDTTPPTVSATSPANAATGVALNTSVSATFSEPMTNSSLTTASFTLVTTSSGAAISGRVTMSGNTATFTPSAAFAGSTHYTATITAAAKDAAGNALATNFTWTFTTAAAPDTTPPTVSATSPANGATGVALNSSLSATFSEAMTNASLTTASVKLATTGGAAVAGTVSVSGNTATFTPTAALAAGTQYTATITTAAKDAAGNAMVANFTWSFTTAAVLDTTPPTVSANSPAGGATGVAPNSSVSATFSEPMTNSTLTTASFMLATTTGGTPVTGMVNVSGNIATFTPSANLAFSTQYTATITTAVKDAAGNALAVNFSWPFTTAAATNTATLAWNAVTAANLGGYRIYYGTAPGTYTQSLGQGLNVGNVTTYTIAGLASRTRYYFVVTAIDTSNNESAYSSEVFKDIP